MSFISALSSFSDSLCAGLVTEKAKHYSKILRTPDHFVEMLLWIEDKRFPIHIGVDPIAMVRALVFNLRGRTRQGASTIAQQVYGIRLSRSQRISRSYSYKLKQIAHSIRYTLEVNKPSLLREYVDTVYWGRSYCGLDRAAEGYFGTKRQRLSIEQSFFLAERLAAPNRVSILRLSNLLHRTPIKLRLVHAGVSISDVIRIYKQIYPCGGASWQLLAK